MKERRTRITLEPGRRYAITESNGSDIGRAIEAIKSDEKTMYIIYDKYSKIEDVMEFRKVKDAVWSIEDRTDMLVKIEN